jgi:hypothetical protein
MNKGQVTIFLIVGVIAIGVFLLAFDISQQGTDISTDSRAIDTAFEQCVQLLAEESFSKLGETGLIHSANYTDEVVPVAYFYIDGRDVMPTKADLENDLERYLSDRMYLCLPEGAVTAPEPDVRVTMTKGSILFQVSYPAIINDGRIAVRLSDSEAVINYDFDKVYGSAEMIVKMTEANPGWIDAGLLAGLGTKVRLAYLSQTEIVYSVEDDKYMYNFAVEVA